MSDNKPTVAGRIGIRRIHLLGFVDEVRHIHENMPDRRFCFILGAGASKTSLIPTAGELGVEWLKKLHIEREGKNGDFAKWLSNGNSGIKELPPKTSVTDISTIAAAYPAIYQAKWGHDRAQGHAEIERHIEAAIPSYGYYALAEILASDDPATPSRHNVVITPNFDNLPAETLGALGKKMPIVIGHSAITDFARPTLRRPLIIKFHHDFLLAPKSNPGEVNSMDKGYSDALAEIFRLYTPIVIGYGGNDGSLMNLLEGLKEKSIPGGILWCWRSGDPPGERIETVVARQGGTLVEISGFDELMALLERPFNHVFDPGKKLRERAEKRALELEEAKKRLGQRAESTLSPSVVPNASNQSSRPPPISPVASEVSSAVLDALSSTPAVSKTTNTSVKNRPPWWHWQNRINGTTDLEQKDRFFKEGIKATKGSIPLIVNYALFLGNELKDYEQAEKYFQKALAVNPNNATTLGSYANFLARQRKDRNLADDYFQRALAVDPKRATHLSNYAQFLSNVQKDYDRADDYYQRALAADPNRSAVIGSYAYFLETGRKDYERSDEYYQKALAADPNNAGFLGNYAGFLANQRKDYVRAEEYYLKALASEPTNASVLFNFAKFLETLLKDYDRAEEYYQKAIAADPSDAVILGSYAGFLSAHRKDFDRAEEYYQKSFAIDSNQPGFLCNYARLIATERRDYERADDYFQKAIASDSNYPGVLGNYAYFLADRREDYERADEFYQKALNATPDDASLLGNYAFFLGNRLKDFKRAEGYFQKALASDSNDAGVLGSYAGFLANQDKDYERAEDYFQKALASDPNHAAVLGNYAKFLANKLKDFVRADEYYQKALAADPNHAHFLASYAVFVANQHKNYEQADKYYQKALASDPNNALILRSYANFLENTLKDYERADEIYQKALATDPNSPGFLSSYANFLTNRREDYERANEYHLKCLAIDPNNVANLSNYCEFLILHRTREEASDYLSRAAHLSSINDDSSSAAAVLWMTGALRAAAGQSTKPTIGALKRLVSAPEYNSSWNFNDLLAWAGKNLSNSRISAFWIALGRVCSGEEKPATLDSLQHWREAPLLTLEAGLSFPAERSARFKKGDKRDETA